jgi:basic amino acid/polyamine antiporter, APA family
MNRSTPSVASADAVAQPTTLPPALGCIDAISMIVGMVIGVGIFETPTLVANNVSSGSILIGLWILGGLLSLIGALCYAELATTYPHPGGNYYYLSRAFGPNLGFLFGWARMTVIQPGSITMLAFVFGDYASQLIPLGDYVVPIYAAVAIVFLTGMNLLGVREGKLTQNGLSIAKVLGLLLVIIVGLVVVTANPGASGAVAPATPSTNNPTNNIGLAMIFVLLSYGGWNEAAYISAEIKDAKHNISRALLWSIGIISAVYVLINLAYLHGLGLQGMVKSEAVAADLLRQAVGQPAALFISLLVAVSALGAANATIFTGARTNFALGKDFPLFKGLSQWRAVTHTPTTALLVQGAIALALVVLGAFQRKGFETMVYYTTPVFWLFFLLSGVALFILRSKEAKRPRPFQVPLYPLTPLLFCLTCGYLLYSSVTYAASQPAGIGVYIGIAVLLLGVPILIWGRQHPDIKPQ